MNNLELIIKKFVFPLSLLVFTSIVFWGLNKGFDLTDEGYYLLGLKQGQDLGNDLTNFHVVIKTIFFWLNLNIINVRIIRIILILLSSFILAYSLRKFIGYKESNYYSFSIVAIFSLASYGFGPQSLSYNSLLASFMTISLSFLLIGLSDVNLSNKKKVNIYLFIAGFLLAISVFIKLTSGLIGVFTFVLFLFLYRRNINFLWLISSLFIGLVVGFITYFLFFQSFGDFYNNFSHNIFSVKDPNSTYGFGHMLKGVYYLIKDILEVFSVLFLLAGSYFLIRNRIRSKRVKCLMYVSLLLIFLMYYFQFLHPKYTRDAFPYLIICCSYIVYILYDFLLQGGKLFLSKKNVFLISLLFVFPFIIAFGTNNDLLKNSLFCLGPWACLMIILNNEYEINMRYSLFFKTLLLLTVGTLFFFQNMQFPYRMPSLNKHTQSMEGISVLLDPELVNSVTQIKSVLKENNFNSGDPIIGFYKIPGLIYLLDGVSPVTPLSVWNKDRLSGYAKLFKASSTDYSQSFVIVNDTCSSLLTKLNGSGINFPNEYVKVATVNVPGLESTTNGNCEIYVHLNNHERIKGDN